MRRHLIPLLALALTGCGPHPAPATDSPLGPASWLLMYLAIFPLVALMGHWQAQRT